MTAEQWVIARLEAHEFALPLQRVMEVLRLVAMEPVPEAPPWLTGVVNLRGRPLPVMDLRTRLGLAPRAPRLDTRIIVAEVGGRLFGLLADEVTEVLSQSAAPIDLPEGLEGGAGRTFLAVQVGQRLISVIDLDHLSAGANGQPLLTT